MSSPTSEEGLKPEPHQPLSETCTSMLFVICYELAARLLAESKHTADVEGWIKSDHGDFNFKLSVQRSGAPAQIH
jgi:hypothetical protein